MIRLRPYNIKDADTILSWSGDAKAFYQWSAGVLGEYPITKAQFGFEDIVLEETEKYVVLGEEWKCLELQMKL